MPRFRRPQQSVVSGLGMAGAVLASVVVTFAVASGIVAYSLTSEDPMATSSAALVLELRASDPADAPLVLRGDRRRRAPERSSARALRAPAVEAASVRGLADGALSASQGGRGANGGTPDPNSGAQTGSGSSSGPARLPVGAALGDTTQAVGATTDSLARRLQAATDNLAAHTEPIVQDTRELLGTAVGRTTGALARLLGPQPSR